MMKMNPIETSFAKALQAVAGAAIKISGPFTCRYCNGKRGHTRSCRAY